MSTARLVWLFGVALVLTGFLPVVLFALGSLLPGAEASVMLGAFPHLPWLNEAESFLYMRKVRWAPSSGLLFAVAGLALMYLGAAIVRWKQPMLDAMKAYRRDARRRRQQYGPSGRVEPTLRLEPTLEAVDRRASRAA